MLNIKPIFLKFYLLTDVSKHVDYLYFIDNL